MTKRIGVAAVFLMGCAVGGVSSQVVVPKASAQQAATVTKWEYLCPRDISNSDWPGVASKAGAEGWDLISTQFFMGTIYGCFKRPKL